jgi:hypothetical protein
MASLPADDQKASASQPPAPQGSKNEKVSVKVEAEEAFVGTTAGAMMRTVATFVTRLPHIPAAKFFRPKTVSPSVQPLPKHAHLSHMIWHMAGGAGLFGTYSFCIALLHPQHGSEKVHGAKAFLAGVVGGIVHGSIMSPVHNLHHLRHLPCHGASEMKSAWKVTMSGGHHPRLLFRGYSATLLADATGFGAFFFTYESIRQLLDPTYCDYTHERNANIPSRSAHTVALHATIAGACAGFSLELFQYPIHHFQHVMARSKGVPARLISLPQLRPALKAEGIVGAYHGIGAFLLRAIPSSALAFLCYEMALLAVRKVVED